MLECLLHWWPGLDGEGWWVGERVVLTVQMLRWKNVEMWIFIFCICQFKKEGNTWTGQQDELHQFSIKAILYSLRSCRDQRVKNRYWSTLLLCIPWRILQVQKERRRGCFQLDPTFQPGRRCVGRPYPWSWPLTEAPRRPLCPPPEAYWTKSPQCCSNTHSRSETHTTGAEYKFLKRLTCSGGM